MEKLTTTEVVSEKLRVEPQCDKCCVRRNGARVSLDRRAVSAARSSEGEVGLAGATDSSALRPRERNGIICTASSLG